MRTVVKVKKLIPLPKLRKKAWNVFSKYIRLRDKGVCFTCDVIKDPKEMNAGHFKHNRLDFSEKNINCQCVHCNKWLSGNLGEYALRLIKKYGQEEVDKLVLEANTRGNKYSRQELEELIIKYKTKAKELV
jgi:hypothetical protein